MSLYYDCAPFLISSAHQAQLKTRIYAAASSQSPPLKSKPAQIYALVSEATRWSEVISDVIDASGILAMERKLSPKLALLLTHDLLISKSGVAAPREHPLRRAVERHRARLSAELTKRRVRAGFTTLREWREAIASQHDADSSLSGTAVSSQNSTWRHPRWIRINTLKTTLAAELSSTFAGFSRAPTLQAVLRAAPHTQLLAVDVHVPDLVAVPQGAGAALTKSAAYTDGRIIFQDKASCFPALLLDPQPGDGDILDACAAPGNKTTHLAALLVRDDAQPHVDAARTRTLYACERDAARAATLDKMTRLAGAQHAPGLALRRLAGQDFLRLDPRDPRFRAVGAILLDPSCSGSGIVGREGDDDAAEHDGLGAERPALVLPRAPATRLVRQTQPAKRKRRGVGPAEAPAAAATAAADESAGVEETLPAPARKPLAERLAALARFQETLLAHAFRFPAARKVAYSTCSRHAAENEHVALAGVAAAAGGGWRVARREEQVEGLRAWSVRGDVGAVAEFVGSGMGDVEGFAEACLRCELGTEEGTMGFFAVLFVKDDEDGAAGGGAHDQAGDGDEDEEEWEGFSNAD